MIHLELKECVTLINNPVYVQKPVTTSKEQFLGKKAFIFKHYCYLERQSSAKDLPVAMHKHVIGKAANSDNTHRGLCEQSRLEVTIAVMMVKIC